jgi:hypothetical protein
MLESDHTMAGDNFSAGTRIEGGIGFRPQMVRGASVPRPNFYGKGGTSIAPFRAAVITFFTSSFST